VRSSAAAFVVCVVLLLLVLPGVTRARAASSYTATAGARLVNVEVAAQPPIAFDPLVDAGASVAQAQIDTLGNNLAFASTPYPGATVIQLPSLVAGIAAGATSFVPGYPLIAAADQTTPTSHKAFGTVVLDARSADGHADGAVTDGATSAVADTTYDPGADAVTASATSKVGTVDLGNPVLSIGTVQARAKAVASGGSVERTSAFTVAGLELLGQAVAVTADGLQLAGTDVPLGLDPSIALAPLLGVLATQGVTLEFVPAHETDDSITSAGLVVTTVVHPPPEAASGVAEVKVRVTVGFATAAVSSRAQGGELTDGSIDLGPTGEVVTGLPDLGDGSSFAAGAPTSPDVVTGAPAGTPTRPVESISGLPVSISIQRVYPVIVLAACAGLALFRLFSNLGVKNP
jgi:hypothetical protein